MITLLRHLSESQWIMLVTFAVIGTLLTVATDASANNMSTISNSTTLSHCGWVQAGRAAYTESALNTRIIQRKLEDMGYSVGKAGIDGRYGRHSKQAVRQFQQDYGLRVDGIVGAETATHLAYATHPTANVRRCKQPYSG